MEMIWNDDSPIDDNRRQLFMIITYYNQLSTDRWNSLLNMIVVYLLSLHMPQRVTNQFLRPSHAQHDPKPFHDFVHGYMSYRYSMVFSYRSMQTNIYIYPKLLRIPSVLHPNFLRVVILWQKTLHSKSSTPQALNNASTVGGPVAVWMPSQLAATNQRRKKKKATLLWGFCVFAKSLNLC